MARVIHDKIPELMKADGKELVVRPAKDNKEFFLLLQGKMIDDVNALTIETTLEGKGKRVVDLQMALMEFITQINSALGANGSDYAKFRSDRLTKVGTLSKRLVTDTVSVQTNATGTDREFVLSYGEEHGWPAMNLGTNEQGRVYLSLGEGEQSWKNAVEVAENITMITNAIRNNEQEKS